MNRIMIRINSFIVFLLFNYLSNYYYDSRWIDYQYWIIMIIIDGFIERNYLNKDDLVSLDMIILFNKNGDNQRRYIFQPIFGKMIRKMDKYCHQQIFQQIVNIIDYCHYAIYQLYHLQRMKWICKNKDEMFQDRKDEKEQQIDFEIHQQIIKKWEITQQIHQHKHLKYSFTAKYSTSHDPTNIIYLILIFSRNICTVYCIFIYI